MISTPEASVVIPCFNQGEYLAETIASVRRQTFRALEIVVVDDGSTDPKTLGVFEEYSRQGGKVLHTPNRGLAAARNYGISHSSGKYVLPLDADDRIAPGYLEAAVAILESDDRVGIVYPLVEFFGEREGVWQQPEFSVTRLLYENMIVASAIFRRADWERVGGYREDMSFGWEDWDFWLSLVECGCGVTRLPEIMFYYQIRADSMTRTLSKRQKFALLLTLVRHHPRMYLRHAGPFLFGLGSYLLGVRR